ncbi:MAG: hypothetical protein M5U08_14635 [Burkholderiales bacterium]|nr:hypothetical protein [Burkholderiales bacterium]
MELAHLALGAPHEAVSPKSLVRPHGVHVDVVRLPVPLDGSACVPRLAI